MPNLRWRDGHCCAEELPPRTVKHSWGALRCGGQEAVTGAKDGGCTGIPQPDETGCPGRARCPALKLSAPAGLQGIIDLTPGEYSDHRNYTKHGVQLEVGIDPPFTPIACRLSFCRYWGVKPGA